MDIFQKKGLEFGQTFKTNDDYVILAESIPAGTTTANATGLALGYICEGYFQVHIKTIQVI